MVHISRSAVADIHVGSLLNIMTGNLSGPGEKAVVPITSEKNERSANNFFIIAVLIKGIKWSLTISPLLSFKLY